MGSKYDRPGWPSVCRLINHELTNDLTYLKLGYTHGDESPGALMWVRNIG